jgi:hypothetical protein
MSPDVMDNGQTASSPITWFAADRPVEGTVYVKPSSEVNHASEPDVVPETD